MTLKAKLHRHHWHSAYPSTHPAAQVAASTRPEDRRLVCLKCFRLGRINIVRPRYTQPRP